MSYILEALKKSEQDRQKSDVASIYTVEHRAFPVEKGISIWAWFFLGLVLCNVFWLALYFLVREPEKPSVTSVLPVPEAAIPSAPQIATTPQSPVSSSQPSAALPRQASNQVTTEKAMVKTYREVYPEAEPLGAPIYETIGPRADLGSSAENQYIENESIEKKHAQKNQIQREKVFPSPYHLPPEIQQQLPSMRFDSHLYSDDANFRSVIVNGQLLHENDWVGDNLLLFKITELGVILRFGSYAFQMPIVEGWVNEGER